jgi:catechol 2,3-dioxygenase
MAAAEPHRQYAYTDAPAGYRLPADTRLGAVRLQVADIARSVAYYQELIGLRVLETSSGRAVLGAGAGAGSDASAVVELNELAGANPVPRRGRLGLYHFAILLPDRAALGRFIAHVSALGVYAGMSDHLVSEAVYLTDPDGLGIEVYADRPKNSWKVNGRSLAMATDPLDTNDLARAAGGAPWDGAPAGTRIGHVHLFVDDLNTGSAFYHDAVGFDKVILTFPGALFMSAGGYHHHLGTNTWAAQAPIAAPTDARLLEWNVIVPATADMARAADSLEAAGYSVARAVEAIIATDPWGTQLRISGERP